MIEWAITASFLILIVLALRAALGGKISAGMRYALWGVVLVRLLLPISLFSLRVTAPLIPAWTPPEAMLEESIYILPVGSAPLADAGVHILEDGTLADANSFGYPRLTDGGERVVRYADKVSPLELLNWIWLAGAVAMGGMLVWANGRFFRRLRRVRRPLEGTAAPIPVYVANGLPSPCLVGALRPAVYVTPEAAADPVILRHVLAHELTHYNHLDHLWSVLRGAALAVHWWNPLVWLAVTYSRRDGELACDEGALRKLGDGERAAYGETLLALVTAKSKPGDLLCFATTMTGEKRSLRERIRRISYQSKTFAGAVVAVAAVLTFATLTAFGQAKAAPEPDAEADAGEAPSVETQATGSEVWQATALILKADGTVHIHYPVQGGREDLDSEPIPAPREWADDDTGGRNKAAALADAPESWARLVSETDGWLVATYGRGVAAADTYVYKTRDGGMTWTEVTMPGTSWYLSDVSFLSPERMIVAQRVFDGAPCFITKDDGETWEKIQLPDDTVVSAIQFDGIDVRIFVGPNESETSAIVLSGDGGDTWYTSASSWIQNSLTSDLDHDGLPDTLNVWQAEYDWGTQWTLEFCAFYQSSFTWVGEAATPHAGWTSYYLCRLDGKDYLLQYTPYMSGGGCYYYYKLFYLTSEGGEVIVRENEVEFDLVFAPEYADQHHFDPEAIASFMAEINALLEKSELLVNTDENLQGTFQQEGRLYDSLWWLDDLLDDVGYRRTDDDLLTALKGLESYAGNHYDEPQTEVYHEEHQLEVHHDEPQPEVHHNEPQTQSHHEESHKESHHG